MKNIICTFAILTLTGSLAIAQTKTESPRGKEQRESLGQAMKKSSDPNLLKGRSTSTEASAAVPGIECTECALHTSAAAITANQDYPNQLPGDGQIDPVTGRPATK